MHLSLGTVRTVGRVMTREIREMGGEGCGKRALQDKRGVEVLEYLRQISAGVWTYVVLYRRTHQVATLERPHRSHSE